ncbi:Response regulator MprA [Sporomusa silvacetica DSM 10669]|uniref:Response regulator MprA n=1 Tax=Sporomusa silvacetica DSM 10669 TaxID=1123289 RepID=A0ABZ3IQ13_9FIRM|nr:response regulator transcription factor [Sporomusa silvacetica]OZC13853.1 response regulator MprA [Sporomusa silvacetica DSM 10669]
MKILLIEDNLKLLDALSHLLKNTGYIVDTATDGKTGAEVAVMEIYDIIILDRMLPQLDGLSVLKELREQGINTPVLILSAKDDPNERAEGLNAGADDYLVKPFAVKELLARLRVLIRGKNIGQFDHLIKAAGLILDPIHKQVIKGKEKIDLTRKEFLLLELLMINCGQVVTRECIMGKVWGYNSDSGFASIDIYIHLLRKKINILNIKTVRGVGYYLQVGYVAPPVQGNSIDAGSGAKIPISMQ